MPQTNMADKLISLTYRLYETSSQAVARIADHTASQQTI